jgi:hypothetical protein
MSINPYKKNERSLKSLGLYGGFLILPLLVLSLIQLLRSDQVVGRILLGSADDDSQEQPLPQMVQATEGQEAAVVDNDDWKLWHLMTATEQIAALEKLRPFVKKYGDLIGHGQSKRTLGTCQMIEFQAGHSLCGPAPSGKCMFFSFGINDDPSFDQTLATMWNCRGFAGDPTVNHPSKLHELVTFHNIGLTMLSPNEERQIDKGGQVDWWTASIPSLMKTLSVEHLDVLKIDCEGCEIAFTRDILAEDRTLLHKVDQISLETHVTKLWINSTETLYYFALQFPLLEEAGFVLEWSDVFGCSKRHEIHGCMPQFEEWGFPCGYKDWPDHPNVVIGRSCQDFLWKRYPEKATKTV